jgi:YaiO family outer membrane protein
MAHVTEAGLRAVVATLALAAASALPFGAAGAAAQARVPVDVEVGASREVLSGDNEAWEDYWIRATVRPAPGTFVYGGLRHTRRFGQEDQQVEAGAGLPLAERWSLSVDGTWSPTARVLPIWGATGTVTHRIAPGWTVFAGGGREEWERVAVNRQHAGVNRHFARVRVGYRLGLHQIDTGRTGVRHGVSGTWTYDGLGSSATLGLAVGRDAMIVGPGDVRTVADQSASIRGTHWLDANTGIGYHFGVQRHGPFFTRNTSSVGIRRRL